jgi:hypothetical protein
MVDLFPGSCLRWTPSFHGRFQQKLCRFEPGQNFGVHKGETGDAMSTDGALSP